MYADKRAKTRNASSCHSVAHTVSLGHVQKYFLAPAFKHFSSLAPRLAPSGTFENVFTTHHTPVNTMSVHIPGLTWRFFVEFISIRTTGKELYAHAHKNCRVRMCLTRKRVKDEFSNPKSVFDRQKKKKKFKNLAISLSVLLSNCPFCCCLRAKTKTVR